jgi:site-specific recombinase XerD
MARLDPDVLTAVEVEALLKVCSRRAPTGIRNRAVFAIAYRSGLRVSEILALHLKDIDFDHGTLAVCHGKGDKARVVGVDTGTAELIVRWLQVRSKLGISRSRPVFTTLQGNPLDPSYFRHALPRLARRAGIEKRTHMHGLRHAHAISLDRAGATPSMIRDALGHSSLSTTDRYLRRLGTGESVAFVRDRPWETA